MMRLRIDIEAEWLDSPPRNWHQVFWPRRMYGKSIVAGCNLYRFILRIWVSRR